jgi:DNA modification methylase
VLARSCQAIAEAKRGNTVETEGGAFNKARVVKNNHPTVKPTDLMQYLCRLITPPNGLIIDPFMGSGSTGKAAMYEGFRFIGIDLDPEYCKIAEARIEFALNKSNVKEEKKPKGVKSSKQTSSDNTDNSSSPLW